MRKEPIKIPENKARLSYPLLLILLMAGMFLVISFQTEAMSDLVILAVGVILMAIEIVVAVGYQRYLSGLEFPHQVEDGFTPWVLDVPASRQDEELSEIAGFIREDKGEVELLYLGRLDTDEVIEGYINLTEEAPRLKEQLIRLMDPKAPEGGKSEAYDAISQWPRENREKLSPLPPETE